MTPRELAERIANSVCGDCELWHVENAAGIIEPLVRDIVRKARLYDEIAAEAFAALTKEPETR